MHSFPSCPSHLCLKCADLMCLGSAWAVVWGQPRQMTLAHCMKELYGCISPQSQVQEDEKVQGQEDGSCVQPPPA